MHLTTLLMFRCACRSIIKKQLETHPPSTHSHAVARVRSMFEIAIRKFPKEIAVWLNTNPHTHDRNVFDAIEGRSGSGAGGCAHTHPEAHFLYWQTVAVSCSRHFIYRQSNKQHQAQQHSRYRSIYLYRFGAFDGDNRFSTGYFVYFLPTKHTTNDKIDNLQYNISIFCFLVDFFSIR